MQFIYGVLATVGFFCCLGGAYMLGRRGYRPQPKQQKIDEDTKEQRRKAKAMNDHFTHLMNYDMEKAIGKKVT